MADIAVIGSGLAGMSCAWWLAEGGHKVTVYAGRHIGGRAQTVLATTASGDTVPVDLGFPAFHMRSSPNLAKLLARLRVTTQPCQLSFAASLYGGELEHSTTLAGLLAQPAQFFSGPRWQMLRDARRFRRDAPALLGSALNPPLLDYLQQNAYSDAFVSRALIPLAITLRLNSAEQILQAPAKSLIQLLSDQGLLGLRPRRGEWRSIAGGSLELLRALSARFGAQILTQRAQKIKRTSAGTLVESEAGYTAYDAVVLACPPDQALTLLTDPTGPEQELLGAIRTEVHSVFLHQDRTQMPQRRLAWAACTYHTHPHHKPAVTYWMNPLQALETDTPLFVSINPPTPPAATAVLAQMTPSVPVLDSQALMAQSYIGHLQGVGGVWFCGGWTGAGLAEDAVTSGLTVAEYLTGQARPWTVREVSRASAHVRPVAVAAEAA